MPPPARPGRPSNGPARVPPSRSGPSPARQVVLAARRQRPGRDPPDGSAEPRRTAEFGTRCRRRTRGVRPSAAQGTRTEPIAPPADAGVDGKMWFTHVSTNKIGKATTNSFVDEVSETVQLARTSRRFFDPPDRDQAVEDVDDELGRGASLRTRLVSRRSAPCAYQVTDAQRWLGPPVSRCLRRCGSRARRRRGGPPAPSGMPRSRMPRRPVQSCRTRSERRVA